MGDLSDFQRALLVGATVPETAQLLEISRSTISKIMTADEKVGKTSSAQHKSSRSSSLFKRDRRTLNRIVRKDHKTTASKKKSSFTLLPTSGHVYIWRQPKEAYKQDCLQKLSNMEEDL